MATRSTRKIVLSTRGDIDFDESYAAAENTSAPGQVQIVTLDAGFNSIAVPTGGTTPKAVTIVPPAGNTTNITLKGVTGDTGLQLHDSDPTSLALDSSVTAIGLTAAAEITGVRLVWT